MELQHLISDFLSTAIIILMTGTVAYSLTILSVQAAQEWLERSARGERRKLWGLLRRRVHDLAGQGFWIERLVLRPLGLGTSRLGGAGGERAHAEDGARAGSDPALQSAALARDYVERRRHKRFTTCLLATLHPEPNAKADNLCDVVDLSAGGARIRPVDRLAETRSVTLGLRHFGLIPAQVVWRRDGEVGLEFRQDPSETVAMMRGLLPTACGAH